jgi:hypothetical protein
MEARDIQRTTTPGRQTGETGKQEDGRVPKYRNSHQRTRSSGGGEGETQAGAPVL